MKSLFSSFYRPTEVQLQKIWNEAEFVFDTNVLLGLYRYPETVAEELLSTIESRADRVWLPHHVALEFYRNRLQVIANQKKKIKQTKDVIKDSLTKLIKEIANLDLDKRHSYIEPNILINVLRETQANSMRIIDDHSSKQIDINDEDNILVRLENIFESRVGPAFKNQTEIDQIQNEAISRFSRNQPPGFEDQNKETESSHVVFNSLYYEKKYGDFIIWKQILRRASESGRAIIFVTDDQKNDWWWKVNSGGPKTLGPRRELIEEFPSVGEPPHFWMYTSEGFLKHANEYFDQGVSNEAISTISSIQGNDRESEQSSHGGPIEETARAERAVLEYLEIRYPNATIDTDMIFPDMLIKDLQTDSTIAAEVIHYYLPGIDSVRQMSQRLAALKADKVADKCFLFITNWSETAEQLENLEFLSEHFGILIICGFIAKWGSFVETTTYGALPSAPENK